MAKPSDPSGDLLFGLIVMSSEAATTAAKTQAVNPPQPATDER